VLTISGCGAARPEEIRKIVSVELGALLVEPTTSSGDATRVMLLCTTGAGAVKVDDPVTGKALTRTVDLSEAAPNARARLLALAIVELIAASWTELETNPAPAVRAIEATASEQARQAALEAVRSRRVTPHVEEPVPSHFALLGQGIALGFPSQLGPLWGGGAKLVRFAGDDVGLGVDVIAVHGSKSIAAGSIAADAFTLGTALYLQSAPGPVVVGSGLGLRAGVARLSGKPNDGSVAHGSAISGGWGGPLLALRALIAPSDDWVLEVAGEAGYTLLPVRGLVGGAPGTAFEATWLAATVSFGWTL
jgi:hypothetical protein